MHIQVKLEQQSETHYHQVMIPRDLVFQVKNMQYCNYQMENMELRIIWVNRAQKSVGSKAYASLSQKERRDCLLRGSPKDLTTTSPKKFG